MTSADYQLIYLEAGHEVLEDYLLSSEVYWPIGASPPASEPPYPRLTLGYMLLFMTQARARDLSPDKYSRLTRVEGGIQQIRSKWRSAWGQKASKEFHSRLSLWKNFLEEYRDNPGNHVDRYNYEVSRRVMLHLLMPEASQIPDEELELLSMLDNLLQAVFIPGDFIWEEELASGFPRKTYWYLYGSPSEPDN